MSEGLVGSPVLVELVLDDRAGGKFPRARIIDSTGAQIGTPLLLVGAPAWTGLYQAEWASPVAGQFSVVFEVYEDAGFTIQSDYVPTVEHLRVLDPNDAISSLLDAPLAGHLTAGSVGEALKIAFADGGGAVRDDAITYDANDRPLTLRRRIFPDAATAAASTPGGTGEGEVITISVNASHLSPSRWQSLLRRRTP